VWYVVCLASLTAMLRARGIMFSTLARTGLEPANFQPMQYQKLGQLIFSSQPLKTLQPAKVVSPVSLT